MDTPPQTPPPIGPSSPDYLDIHYWDFAYEEKGPFRMPTSNIADTTSKTFAECIFRQTAAKLGERRDKVELFDDDPRAFELLVKWLYQGRIDDVGTLAVDRKWDYAFACQQLYILCEKINMPELKNVAIDQFRKGCYEAGLVPGAEEMILVYQKTSRSSPFRKLVSKIAARQLMDPECEQDSSIYRDCFAKDPDFAIDVINAIKEGTGLSSLFEDPTEEEGCHYHDHPSGQYCNIRFNKRVS
ncbi:uncharacterized protein KY384_007463 [Bacidia gigantensis]|uniref:uncharacterized protein n=1 Tax=Bacidia gigantensis TaxID=2732470 RepID=UPI001D04C8FD|nr:uncharacterized protein KY384_007463 [Bacidia gigantensis]KAG8528545.1 hypothetical protein KY384_007463 [Bacidia gigantensis]